MKIKLITLFFILCSSYINSEVYTKNTYEGYIEQLINLKSELSDNPSRREKGRFLDKWSRLHGVNSPEGYITLYKKYNLDCFSSKDNSDMYEFIKTCLNDFLILNEMKEKYGSASFAFITQHISLEWDIERISFNHVGDLFEAFTEEETPTNPTEIMYLIAYLQEGILAAKILKAAESTDIGFNGQVEVFSQAYNDRIEKRIADIDKESGGLLSTFTEMDFFENYPEKALEKLYTRSMNPYNSNLANIQKYCDNIFEEKILNNRDHLQGGYNKKINFCDATARRNFLTDIYSITPKILQNYSPDILFHYYDGHRIFPSTDPYRGTYKYALYLSIGPEVLFNAKYGLSTGLNIAKKLIDLRTEIQNEFYKDIVSLDDMKRKLLNCCDSEADVQNFKKLIQPRSDKEKRIFAALESYLPSDEFKRDYFEAQSENELREILQDSVVKDLIRLEEAMQMIDKCYFSRAGYSTVYVNNVEWDILKSLYNENFKDASERLDPDIRKRIDDIYGLNNFIKGNVDDISFWDLAFGAGAWTSNLNEVCTKYKLNLQGFSF
tara:strand:- start:311 stop:1963 length:1653 start_codon:yes stop_codon:yes gene_type:complete